MKRCFSVLIITLLLSSVLLGAEPEKPKSIELEFTIDSGNANYREFGFSETEVTSANRAVTYGTDEGLYALVDSTPDLSVIATGRIYAYWKVTSADKFTMRLTGTPLENGAASIDWVATWQDKGVVEGKSNTWHTYNTANPSDDNIVYTHNPGAIGEGGKRVGVFSIDSIPIEIITEDGADMTPGTYSGTLTLTVIDGI